MSLTNPSTSNQRDNAEGLITFRLPEDEDEKLLNHHKENQIVGVRSKHQFARKIVLDYLCGRLVYLDPSSRSDNTLIAQRG